MDEKQLKSIARAMEATIRIGKNGITDEIIEEIKKQLKKRKIVKIKMLKSFTSANEKTKAVNSVIKKTKSKLIYQIGGTLVIFSQKPRSS